MTPEHVIQLAAQSGLTVTDVPSKGVSFKVSNRPTKTETERLLRIAFYLGRLEAKGKMIVTVDRHRKIIGVRERIGRCTS